MKTKCILFALFATQYIGLLSVQAYAQEEYPKNEVRFTSSAESHEVLADLMFTQGFILTGATHDAPVRTETFGLTDITPAWQIAQWNSKGLLDHIQYDDDTIVLTDDYKSVTVDRKSGAINLTVHASKEYTTPRTSSSEPWVHLLLEQSAFQEPVKVANASEIWAEVEFELTENKASGQQNPAIHAAQLSWFLYLRNTNPQSIGFNDFVWFGLGMFDSRYDFVPDYASQDFATSNGSFIYTVGSKNYFDKPVKTGERKTIRRNIKIDIQKAVEKAHQYGFIKNTNIYDLELTGTNIGWEVPGVYDVGVTLHKLSVSIEETLDGIDTATVNKAITGKTYYDLSGRQVSQEAKGILLEKAVYEDDCIFYKKVCITP